VNASNEHPRSLVLLARCRRLRRIQNTVLEPPESHPDSPTVRIAGFSDINFEATDRPGSRSGFNEGQFILHFSSALSPRVSFFGELSLTARADTGTGTPPAPGTRQLR
jgi:hypothetical protein